MNKLRKFIESDLLQNSFSASKLGTLIIDTLIPLASAYYKKDLFGLWYHWFSGDVPDSLKPFLSQTELITSRDYPTCNSINQGIMHVFLRSKLLVR